MPGSDYALSAVARAVKEGVSATRALDIYRKAGGSIRTQTWYQHYGEVQAALGNTRAELGKPLNRRPTADEIKPWTTAGASGFMQRVEVFVRDRGTGEVFSLPYSISSQGLVTRSSAIQQALDMYSDFAEDYDQQVLGGLYLDTMQMTPGI